ncbi:MAG TPA: WD40 repeat domain-containing protein, partial [Longimicrobiaceae bacterium]|nr:WD40 repeat domain-containing protein [Longimicrobiaceae bacterium]
LERLVTSQGRKIALTVEELAGPATADVQRIHELVRYLEARSVVRNAGPPPGQTETARNRRWEITHDVLAAAAGQWRTEYLQREAARAAEAEHDAAVRRAEARLRRRVAWAAFGLGTLIAGAGGGLEWWHRSQVRVQDGLRREQAQGLSNTIAALARFQLPHDAGLAAALANVADSINSRDETLGLLQRAVFEPVNTFSFATGGQPIVALEPLRDGRFFIATLDGRVFLRDSAGPAAPVAGTPGPLEAAVLLPGGRAVAVASRRPARILRRALGDTLTVEMPGHTERIYSLAVAPGGSLLSVAHDGLVLRHPPTGPPIRIGKQNEAAVSVAAGSGGMVAAGGEGGLLRVWNPAGTAFAYSQMHTWWIASLSFGAGDTLLVSAGRDTAVHLWRVERRDPAAPRLIHLRQLRGHTGWMSSAVFSPDNAHVLTASTDGTARVWQTATGWQVATLPHPAGVGVRSARFLPDGRIVTAGEDGVVRLWDWTVRSPVAVAEHVEPDSSRVLARGGGVELGLPEGSRVPSLRRAGSGWTTPLRVEGHRAKAREVRGAAITATGRRVATAEGDDTVRIWDGVTGALRRRLAIEGGSIEGLAFTPDGLRLIGVTGDGTSYAWNLDGAQRARVDPAYDPSVIVPGATPWMLVPRRGQAQVYACDVCRPRDTLKQRFPSHLRSLTPLERARYLGSSRAP